ncbi:MAG: (d)CMP kinase [Clostridiales bacterium]|nr:(d)CMP kinase [Clostridiales bacterium]
MFVRAIRGAITVSKNEQSEVLEKTSKLINRMISENNVLVDDIVNIIFSVTADIDCVYPAKAIRDIMGILDIPMMCFSEAKVNGSLSKCIRVLMQINTNKRNREIYHIYLGGARVLRKDLARKINIAIDGPAGAGKSTIADILAKKLSIMHVDTGAMYRALAYDALNRSGDITSEEEMEKIVANIQLEQKDLDGEKRIYLNGEDVTTKIRTPEMSAAASDVSKLACVRKKLTQIQRDIAKKESVIMDGRDIGSYVLENADLKIFLTASIEERAKRRYKDLLNKGEKNISLNEVKNDIMARDANDTNRKISPLKMAKDAVCIDSTGLSIDEVIAKIEGLVEGI